MQEDVEYDFIIVQTNVFSNILCILADCTAI